MTFRKALPIGRHENLSTDISGLIADITTIQARKAADHAERADIQRTLCQIDRDVKLMDELLTEAETRLADLTVKSLSAAEARREEYKPKFSYMPSHGFVDNDPDPRDHGKTFTEAEVRRRLNLPPLERK